MPPKKGKKGKRRKGKRKKKGKKKKIVPEPPPLHELTTLYNKLIEMVEEFKVSRNKARKKRIEAWYMTREMMNLAHDNAVYHKYLKDKMDELERLLNELTDQLNKEREELEKIIAKRIEEIDKIIAEYKARTAKAEAMLLELKNKLLEFEPLMRELAALMAKLRELQALIPIYELEANIKTRHLKNQYLHERSRLHNHLENELYLLILTCRSHLMPILADHMSSMELENKCNRWELGALDQENFRLYRQREKLLEKRNKLNIEREYLSIDWAFNKLAIMDRKKEDARAAFKQKKGKRPDTEEECELAIAFKSYLSKKLGEIEEAKEREKRAQIRREAREKRLQREAEKKRRKELLEAKRAKFRAAKLRKAGLGPADTEDEGGSETELEDEWGELEYYEDDEGNWVIATPSRMAQHKAIMENKTLADVDQQVEDIKNMLDADEESSYSSSSSSYSSSEGSLESMEDIEEEMDEKRKSKKSDGGDFDADDVDFGQDDFGFDDFGLDF